MLLYKGLYVPQFFQTWMINTEKKLLATLGIRWEASFTVESEKYEVFCKSFLIYGDLIYIYIYI